MEKNGSAANAPEELLKELAGLRARFAEIASTLRRGHGLESSEARLAEEAAIAVQKLEAQLAGCVSARFEA